MTTRTVAMHSDPGPGRAKAGGGVIRPPWFSVVDRWSAWPARAIASLPPCLFLAAGLWLVPAEAQALKAAHLRATPAPFELGTVTVACELKRGRRESRPEGSSPEQRMPHARYRFRVEDAATGSRWETPWQDAPALEPRSKTSVASVLRINADSVAAGRITELTISILIHDGADTTRSRGRSYYRWGDGRFRDLLEWQTQASPWSQGATQPVRPGTRWATVGTSLATTPVSADAIPRRRKTWGAVKVLYRGETSTIASPKQRGDSDAGVNPGARPAPSQPDQQQPAAETAGRPL
jgi:hypothetical protein